MDQSRILEEYRLAGANLDRAGLAHREIALTELVGKDIIARLAFDKADTVVDLGCGDGWLLANLPQVTRRIGIAPSDEEVSALRLLHPSADIEFVRGSWDAIPLQDGTASKLVCNSVLLHLPSHEMARIVLMEIRRVCRSGAAVYIGEMPSPMTNRWLRLAKRPFEVIQTHGPLELAKRCMRFASRTKRPSAGGDYFRMRSSEFASLCSDAQFSVVSIEPHVVRDGTRRLEYPRDRYNVLLRA